MDEISVYIFLGFLESGKTKFIQETFEDPRMDSGENTLLLVCEEGEEEYNPDKFKVSKVTKVTLESAEELNMKNLSEISEKHGIKRVIVEYNGTWKLNQFFEAMPENWVVNQIMTFFDATTFLNYNKNMRPLVFDKMQMTQMVVFNRFKDEYDKTEFHKIVRGVSRRPDIVYEKENGAPEFDEIEDPLPYDMNAEVVEIEDRDFAWFASDMSENLDNYVGKTVKFKGVASVSKKDPKGIFVLGRHIMTCCEADIAYGGFAVKANGVIKKIKSNDWIILTAKVVKEYCEVYGEEGPVLVALKAEPATRPKELVVTYY